MGGCNASGIKEGLAGEFERNASKPASSCSGRQADKEAGTSDEADAAKSASFDFGLACGGAELVRLHQAGKTLLNPASCAKVQRYPYPDMGCNYTGCEMPSPRRLREIPPGSPIEIDPLKEQGFQQEGDEARLIRCSEGQVSSDEGALALIDDKALRIHEVWLNGDSAEDAYASDDQTVEFMACSSSHTASVTIVSLFFNDDKPLNEKPVALTSNYRYYHFRCSDPEPIRNVVLVWDMLPSSDDASDHVMQLDPRFGVRVNGYDMLHTMRFQKTNWRNRGIPGVMNWLDLRGGKLQVCPGRFVVENLVEFVVHGLTGLETIDVYVNGMAVQCASEFSLKDTLERPKLLRYEIAPMSCVIGSVLVRVRSRGEEPPSPGRQDTRCAEPWCGLAPEKVPRANSDEASPIPMRPKNMPADYEAGVIIDASFGFMVGGQDCLGSTVFMESPGKQQPAVQKENPDIAASVRKGRWMRDGFYHLLPYRRKMKPYETGSRREG
eukprot:TRINITY_DN45283_c0_g1_i1.p1 TRINITY_DN45283_c0_g1~~TRINITY_DN45283_c0_g1_i1.p1  ORF type:complete len:495 (+),score=89.41 TRINITY_DN45283_c0_g1_i1:80-1564(+)